MLLFSVLLGFISVAYAAWWRRWCSPATCMPAALIERIRTAEYDISVLTGGHITSRAALD